MRVSKRERRQYRQWLEKKAAELAAGFRTRDRIAIEPAADAVDEMLLAQEREWTIRSLDREAVLLREVRAALDRLADGTWGICQQCDGEISAKRLAALPWAAYCRTCQEVVDGDGARPRVELSGPPLPWSAAPEASRWGLPHAA